MYRENICLPIPSRPTTKSTGYFNEVRQHRISILTKDMYHKTDSAFVCTWDTNKYCTPIIFFIGYKSCIFKCLFVI